MKIHLAAAALAVAIPAVAHAEPKPEPKAEMPCCCEKMGKMPCCEKHRKDKGEESGDRSDAHKGHDRH